MKLGHPLVARNDVQVKPHKIGRNQWAAVYAAVILLPLRRFLTFAGDRPANDDAIQGPCQLRWLLLLLLQNRLPRPDLVP